MKIAIFGATGYTGTNLTEEALRRGHEVVAVSRSGPSDDRPGVEVRTGSVQDPELVGALAAEADVVVLAVPALWPDGRLADLVPGVLATVAQNGTRLGVVGGAGSLLTAPDGPALYDTGQMPAPVLAGSRAQGEVLAALQTDPGPAEWFYLSPAAAYGHPFPGERTGHYRTGGDLLLTDAHGRSAISGADYAIAFLDEIERPQHTRTRFTVAY